ncbi:hypothetical protein O181_011173 [Austropuccinia psidii MF-1]|uniref:Uncharacterized protein n=1 Tax=Austropuccinia psidii MF-1 TaxID=1389203 RepID=A0A9Q3GL22_9BASI|nr:hypothetical protein [Austropuccinia psidii MF-1]
MDFIGGSTESLDEFLKSISSSPKDPSSKEDFSAQTSYRNEPQSASFLSFDKSYSLFSNNFSKAQSGNDPTDHLLNSMNVSLIIPKALKLLLLFAIYFEKELLLERTLT